MMKPLFLFLSLLASTVLFAIPPDSIQSPALTIGQQKAKDAQLKKPLDMELVDVTDAGNLADTNGRGAVAQNFKMGKFDVTASQYCQFLNAVASKSDPYALYNEKMNSDPHVASITRQQEKDLSFTYFVKQNADRLPIAYVSWFAAARFCNWMHNGQLIGNEDSTTTETGAYTLNGAMKDETGTATVAKSDYCKLKDGAKCFLPTEDQWYKAAYYKHAVNNKNGTGDYWDYPTKTDLVPLNENDGYPNRANYFIASNRTWFGWNYQYTNGGKDPFLTDVGIFRAATGPYGTFDMGGNLFQWVSNPGYAGTRVIRGGSWKKQQNDELKRTTCITANPAIGYNFVGFRIATPAM